MTDPTQVAPAGSRAGLLPRLGAAAYEALLIAALIFVASFLLLPLISPARPMASGLTVPPVPARVALFCTLFSILALYFVFSWTNGRRTLPMKTWRLFLAMPDGRPPTTKVALLRYLTAWIGPALAIIGYGVLREVGHGGWAWSLLPLNFAWALVDADRQFLHDRIAGTRIVKDA